MTVVEFFGQEHIVNIATCLSLRPNKLIFIGDAETLASNTKRYTAFFAGRNLLTEVISRPVPQNNIQNVIAELEMIIKDGDEVVIDLAGGDHVAIAAAGAVYERYVDEYPVSLQRVDPITGNIQDCDGDGEVEWDRAPRISVKELVELYGGSIAPFDQIVNQATLEDIRLVWDMSIQNIDCWNNLIAVLNRFEKYTSSRKEQLRITAYFNELQTNLPNYNQEKPLFVKLIQMLQKNGLIQIEQHDNSRISYVYKNLFVRRCLNSPGNTLEFKTILEARNFNYRGRPFFTDSRRSVSIDWDGIIHPSIPGGIKDTKNEIDVVLMRGMTPVFISCKNGAIKEEELYKLGIVAERFGGDYAKKVLIATNYMPEKNDTKLSFSQRAADMGIYFEPNAADFTPEEWGNFFLEILKNE